MRPAAGHPQRIGLLPIVGAIVALLVLGGERDCAALDSAGGLEPFSNVSISAIAIDPAGSAVYVGAGEFSAAFSCSARSGPGVFKSADGGATWTNASAGLSGSLINALAADRATGALYAATSCGVFKTTNGGARWNAINSGLPPGPADPVGGISALVVDPSSPATLYALSLVSGDIVFKTTNGGASWTPIKSGLPGQPDLTPISLAIAPSNPATLYFGAVVAPSRTVVFKTTDGGAHWTETSSGLPPSGGNSPQALAINPTNADTVYAAVTNGNGTGFYETTNGGASWSRSNASFFWALAIDPTNPAVLYGGDPAFVGGGVYKSSDAGATFAARSPYLAAISLAIDPANTATVYAGGNDCDNAGRNCTAKLIKTTDGGASWWLLTSPPPPPGPCRQDTQTLCLLGERFKVEASWVNQFNGTSGAAAAISSTESTGFFYFFDPSNDELIVKILDFGNVFKVFYAELTNLHFTMTITDTKTGRIRTYRNTPGDCGAIDQNGFAAQSSRAKHGQVGTFAGWPDFGALEKRGSCGPADGTLCLLDRRFGVTVSWMN
jgi:hypothetical protein